MIKFINDPRAGEKFEFKIIPEPGEFNHRIQAFVAGEQIYNNELDCEDPPCHEMFFINENFVDRTLTVRYSSNIVDHQYQFRIQSGL